MKKAQPSDAVQSSTNGTTVGFTPPEPILTPMPAYPLIITDDPVAVYDPTQEIVDRLDRIAKAIEESNILARAELRVKGIAP